MAQKHLVGKPFLGKDYGGKEYIGGKYRCDTCKAISSTTLEWILKAKKCLCNECHESFCDSKASERFEDNYR